MSFPANITKQLPIPRVLSAQFVMVLILISGYSWIIIDSDITFFDTYVLEDISYCNPDRYDQEHCQSLRESTGCIDSMDQNCIGGVYWQQVEKQAYGLAVILFLARIIPSLTNHFSGRRAFDKVAIVDAIWWSSLALIVFLFGVIDYGYYVMRGMDIPDVLPWLDHVGVFVHTKVLTGDPTIVDAMDLKITFVAGLLAMGGLLFIISAIYKAMGNSRRKLIR
jgi:hypothetical protein